MPEIPGLPVELITSPGVHMTPPPPDLLPEVEGVISKAVASLGEGERGKFVWILQTKDGQQSVNAAFVQKVNDKFDVTMWIGKTWGHPIEAGIAGTVTW